MKCSKADKRQNTIIEMLSTGKTISVEEFCQTLCCSASTIRNDLNHLANIGKVTRVFGGAKSIQTKGGMISLPDSDEENRRSREIAAYVTEHLIPLQSTIILDSGTTCLEIARLLAKNNFPVSVLTFSLPIINILAEAEAVNLYSFGGFYHMDRGAFFDDYIEEHTKLLHADIYFMITSSVSPEAGFTISCQDKPITERSLMRVATKTIALCNSSNISKSGYRIISDFTEISSMVTDSEANQEHLQKLQDAGLNVLVAGQ